MNIEIQSRNVKLTSELRKLLKKRVGFAFNRFKHQIQAIKVSLKDINGPKGGIDKSCQFHVTLPDQSDLIVKGKADGIEAAISETASRCAASLSRRLKRKSQFKAIRYPVVEA